MTYKAIIFDWDGTVVDSADHIADCLLYAASSAGLPALEHARYRHIIGLGIAEALESLYPGISPETMEHMRETYRERFLVTAASAQRVFEGITELLAELGDKGRPCAIATGKSRRGLELALAGNGLHSYFAVSRCADETCSKPDPTMLREIVAHFGIHPREAVMIGDTSYDMEMARRIDMPAIGVSWGVHDHGLLRRHEPLAVVDAVGQLREHLALK